MRATARSESATRLSKGQLFALKVCRDATHRWLVEISTRSRPGTDAEGILLRDLSMVVVQQTHAELRSDCTRHGCYTDGSTVTVEGDRSNAADF